jgi:phosphoglycolate phosphatase
MNLFFDLDGTLIDSRQRLYQLFQYLVPQSRLSFDDYWNLKRNNINNELILKERFNTDNYEYGKFETDWMKLIETEEYLNLDQPFVGVSEYLNHLKDSGMSLYISTSRQFRQSVIYQLDRFGWSNFFEVLLVTGQKFKKEELIRPFVKSTSNSWIIGDTGQDIIAGKLLGQKTVAVLSGFLNYNILATYKPDLIVDNVIHFTPF